MTVICDDETKEKLALKEAMRKTGTKRVREACALFVAELKVHHPFPNTPRLANTSHMTM